MELCSSFTRGSTSFVRGRAANGSRRPRSRADRLLKGKLFIATCHERERVDRATGNPNFVMKMASSRAPRRTHQRYDIAAVDALSRLHQDT